MAAGINVGSVFFDVGFNNSAFRKGVNTEANFAQKTFGDTFSKIGKMAAVAFSIKTIVDFTKSAINMGSNLTEVQNVIDVTFGAGNAAIENFSKTAINAFGLSELSAKKYVGTMGSMLKSMKLPTHAAQDMSLQLAALAGDLSSFHNRTTEEAFAKIRSGMSGETESLKELGINMSVANLEAYALSQGLGGNVSAMGQAQQALLRYNYLLDVTSDAQGDFARNAGTWANQTRILKLNWDSFKASMGQGFIQLLTPIISWLNRLMAVLVAVGNTFKNFINFLFGGASAAGNTAASVAGIGTAATEAGDSATKAAGGAGKAADKAAKKAKGALLSFDELNNVNVQDPAESGGGGGGGGGGVDFTAAAPGTGVFGSAMDDVQSWMRDVVSAAQPTVAALQKLWVELKRFGAFVFDDLKSFYIDFLKPVGSWVLGEGLPGFINALTTMMSGIDYGKILAANKGLRASLAAFTIKIGKGLGWVWEKIILPILSWNSNFLVPAATDALTAALDGLNTALDVISPVLDSFYNAILVPLGNWAGETVISAIGGLKSAFEGVTDWIKNNQGTVQVITAVLVALAAAWGTVTLAVTLWNVAAGIATAVTTAFGVAVAILTSPITLVVLAIAAVIAIVWLLVTHWDAVVAAARRCWDGIVEKWNAATQWFADTVLDPLKTAFNDALTAVGDFFVNAWITVETAWEGVKQWFTKTVIDPVGTAFNDTVGKIAGLFSGAWGLIKGAWEGAVSWFKKTVIGPLETAFNKVAEVIKGVLNGVIGIVNGAFSGVESGINWCVDKVNALKITNPFTGTEIWSPNLSRVSFAKIPELAKGGIVSQPTLSMIGEAGKEAVLPLENNTGWMATLANVIAEALAATLATAQGSEQVGRTEKTVLELDGRVLGEVVLPHVLAAAERQGLRLGLTP